jgi:hypothetical protein
METTESLHFVQGDSSQDGGSVEKVSIRAGVDIIRLRALSVVIK